MHGKKLRRRCEHCDIIGEVNKEIFWMTDPYMQDVRDEVIKRWLHFDCCIDIAQDI